MHVVGFFSKTDSVLVRPVAHIIIMWLWSRVQIPLESGKQKPQNALDNKSLITLVVIAGTMHYYLFCQAEYYRCYGKVKKSECNVSRNRNAKQMAAASAVGASISQHTAHWVHRPVRPPAHPPLHPPVHNPPSRAGM